MAGVLKTVNLDSQGDGAFISGHNDPNLSNEQIVLIPTTVALPAGTVIAKYTSGGNVGKWGPLIPGASDGSQTAAGILFGRREINTAAQKAVAVVRKTVVNGNLLTYINTVTTNQKAAAEAALASAMLMVRY